MVTAIELATAASHYKEVVEQAKQERDTKIRQAAEEGWKQTDIVKETGLTRETVRRITNPEAAEAVRRSEAARRAAKKKET